MVQKPALSIHTGTEDLGNVFREQNNLTLKYIEGNLPFSTDVGRFSLQWLGKIRIIMIQGAHDGTGFTGGTPDAKINNFISSMNDWLNAAIASSITYYDSFGNSYTVDGVDFTWTRSNNDPYRILYSLIVKRS
jgi:hypothetical protein